MAIIDIVAGVLCFENIDVWVYLDLIILNKSVQSKTNDAI